MQALSDVVSSTNISLADVDEVVARVVHLKELFPGMDVPRAASSWPPLLELSTSDVSQRAASGQWLYISFALSNPYLSPVPLLSTPSLLNPSLRPLHSLPASPVAASPLLRPPAARHLLRGCNDFEALIARCPRLLDADLLGGAVATIERLFKDTPPGRLLEQQPEMLLLAENLEKEPRNDYDDVAEEAGKSFG